MFTENEIATLIEIPEVNSITLATKEKFKSDGAKYMELSGHDFLALTMMTPAVGIALANGSVSLFEELALNKLARKMSKGGYFLKSDPVAHAMNYLIKHFERWEQPFFEVIKVAINATVKQEALVNPLNNGQEVHLENFAKELMGMPYIFVRFLSLFFLHDETDIIEERFISKVEYEKILDIGTKLDLASLSVFQSFCKTFKIK